MISSKNLAEAIYKISSKSKKDDDIILNSILDYVKSYKLESLLPKTLIYLEDKIKKEKKWNTFLIESRYPLNLEMLEKIKVKLKIEKETDSEKIEKKEIIGGFKATYQGIIYDGSLQNQLQLLKNSLIK
jgi:F0F1-type ATP synthase delta subunit